MIARNDLDPGSAYEPPGSGRNPPVPERGSEPPGSIHPSTHEPLGPGTSTPSSADSGTVPGSTSSALGPAAALSDGTTDDGYYADKERATMEALGLLCRVVVPILIAVAAVVIVCQHLGWID